MDEFYFAEDLLPKKKEEETEEEIKQELKQLEKISVSLNKEDCGDKIVEEGFRPPMNSIVAEGFRLPESDNCRCSLREERRWKSKAFRYTKIVKTDPDKNEMQGALKGKSF